MNLTERQLYGVRTRRERILDRVLRRKPPVVTIRRDDGTPTNEPLTVEEALRMARNFDRARSR